MTQLTKTIKHSGADWLQRQLKFELSEFGVKVANILGQVYLGIYHIDRDILRNTSVWENDKSIAITVLGELATYDLCKLTLLFLCCQEAKIKLIIAGSKKGYLQLIFNNNYQDYESDRSVFIEGINSNTPNPLKEFVPKNFKEAIEHYCYLNIYSGVSIISSKKDVVWVNTDDQGVINSLQIRSVSLLYQEIGHLLALAHNSATRIAISGRCPKELGLGLSFYKRSLSGAMHERHPTVEQAISDLKPYWEINYAKQ